MRRDEVASDPSVPNRPDSRLKRKAEKLEKFQNGSRACAFGLKFSFGIVKTNW